ncbi:MAG: Zn-dependent alcohol dehydrogenase [Acidimicrobiia bacterium]
MRAAVFRQVGDETLDVVDDAELVDVAPGTVRVAIRATGVCHSDLEVMKGTYGIATPCVLGHEGVGEIVEVGAGVTDLAVGDHVLATGVIQCGRCTFCLSGQGHLCIEASFVSPYFRVGGEPAFALAGIGSFSEEVLLAREAAVKIPPDVPWEAACFVGCGVTTGVGAVLNAAKLTPGSSVIVFGCGGVGTAVIQSARLSGATSIVAVDPVVEKRERARNFGATHTASPNDVARVKAELTGDAEGFDYAFEAVGLPVSIRAAYDAVRRGGTAVIVGVGRTDQPVEFNAYELAYGDKTLRGTWFGSGDPRVDFPRVLALWRAGRLDLEGMITRRARLEDINDVFDDMRTGTGIRTVLTV